MSKQKHILIIEPTEFHCKKEKMYFSGGCCTRCDGKGGFTAEVGRDEYKTETCTFCDGTGKVRAEVVISWLPEYGC